MKLNDIKTILLIIFSLQIMFAFIIKVEIMKYYLGIMAITWFFYYLTDYLIEQEETNGALTK